MSSGLGRLLGKLSAAALRECFQDYRASFPEWEVKQDGVLVRRTGLLRQVIAFERVRGHAYRPSCSVELLVSPTYQILFAFLAGPRKETRASEHTARWKDVVAAMETQFTPAIRSPLSLAAVIRAASDARAEGGAGNVQRVAGMAILFAIDGDLNGAARCCQDVEGLVDHSRPQADWERTSVETARELLGAIKAGRVEQFLVSRSSLQG